MFLSPPESPRTDTLLPYTPLFRSRKLPLQSRSVDPWRDDRRRTPTDRRGLPERWLRRLQDAGGQGNLHHWQDEPRSGERSGRSRRHPPCLQNARSEEHTSELQSLMRISYAVFCLKKKTKHNIVKTNPKP